MNINRRAVLLGGAGLLLAGAARGEDHVFLNYTQSELDRAYDQSAWAPNAAAIQARYASDSANVRKALKPRTKKYGPSDAEVLDIFGPPVRGRAPIHVFFHGGAWLLLTKDDADAPATTFVDSGAIYVAVNFANIKAVRLPGMLDQCRRALLWVRQNAASFGGDADRIFVSGHSSGAHLAALLLTTNWAAEGQPANLIKGGVLMSGIYDLHPVMLSSRRSYVALTPDEVVALSPIRHLDQLRCPVSMAWGDQDSPEFKRQGLVMADAILGMGLQRTRNIVFNANHFEVAEQLNRSDTPLGRSALAMMGLA